MKQKAKWTVCNCGETEQQHMMRDGCYVCAPWWWNVPVCAECDRKLATSGWCKQCKKYRDLTKDEHEAN